MVQKILKPIIGGLILWPEKVAAYILDLGPLLARLVLGEVFMMSGWGKLQNLELVTENFIGWGIPYAYLLTPLVSGVEFIGGLLLILGLVTRISAGMLAVIMLVAIRSALWDQVAPFNSLVSLDTLLGFSESAYFALFTWLAIAGAGKLSLDYWLTERFKQ